MIKPEEAQKTKVCSVYFSCIEPEMTKDVFEKFCSKIAGCKSSVEFITNGKIGKKAVVTFETEEGANTIINKYNFLEVKEGFVLKVHKKCYQLTTKGFEKNATCIRITNNCKIEANEINERKIFHIIKQFGEVVKITILKDNMTQENSSSPSSLSSSSSSESEQSSETESESKSHTEHKSATEKQEEQKIHQSKESQGKKEEEEKKQVNKTRIIALATFATEESAKKAISKGYYNGFIFSKKTPKQIDINQNGEKKGNEYQNPEQKKDQDDYEEVEKDKMNAVNHNSIEETGKNIKIEKVIKKEITLSKVQVKNINLTSNKTINKS